MVHKHVVGVMVHGVGDVALCRASAYVSGARGWCEVHMGGPVELKTAGLCHHAADEHIDDILPGPSS